MRKWYRAGMLVLPALAVLTTTSSAQDRLTTYPGYDAYQKFLREVPGALRGGVISQIKWTDDNNVEYNLTGKRYRYDVRTLTAAEIPLSTESVGMQRGGPERGRQFDSALSPDKKLKAFYKDRN